MEGGDVIRGGIRAENRETRQIKNENNQEHCEECMENALERGKRQKPRERDLEELRSKSKVRRACFMVEASPKGDEEGMIHGGN